MQIETFLDMFLIEEIPVENATSTGIVGAGGQEIVRSMKAAKQPQTGRVVSCGKQFPYNGVMIDNPYSVGDVVRTNAFGRNYIVLEDANEFRPDAKKHYLIRYDDIEGRVAIPRCGRRNCQYELGHFGECSWEPVFAIEMEK